ncbi:MAG TPA: GYD domain-containing protein [Actinomycetota bacterium]|jgi:uncharacterized protein with GYD domain|nr:GYD domain-containing protein [Actinomycetota bacterium]
MPKYLLVASYTPEGAKGLLKDGGSKRKKMATKTLESIGGSVEAFYFAFGSDDAYVIYDAPDNASSAAASLVVAASGAIKARTIPLLTPEDIDDAAKKSKDIDYTPPGK